MDDSIRAIDSDNLSIRQFRHDTPNRHDGGQLHFGWKTAEIRRFPDQVTTRGNWMRVLTAFPGFPNQIREAVEADASEFVTV